MMMQRPVGLAVGMAIGSVLLSSPHAVWGLPSAQPSTVTLTDTCKATLFDTEQRFEGYKRAYVPQVRLFFAEAGETFTFADPLNVTFRLEAYDSVISQSGDVVVNSSALDIMASDQLLLALTREIVEACAPIVSVTYLLGEYQQRTFGLVAGAEGPVAEFACAEDLASPLPWGVQYCLTEF